MLNPNMWWLPTDSMSVSLVEVPNGEALIRLGMCNALMLGVAESLMVRGSLFLVLTIVVFVLLLKSM